MKVDILQITGFCEFTEVITQQTWLDISCIACKDKAIISYITIVFLTNIEDRPWNGDVSDRAFAFGFSYKDLCM